MRKSTTLPVVLAAILVCSGAGEQAQPKQVYVTVADQQTKPVTGLTAADFRVTEDGAVREIVSVTPAAGPTFIILSVDTATGTESSRNIPRNITDLRNGVVAFTKTFQTASPNAQIALWEHAGAALAIKGFTAKAEDIEKEARRLVFKTDPSVSLEMFVDAAKELKRKEGRRILVATIFDSSPEQQHIRPADVAKEVRDAYSQVWTVAIRDRPNVASWRDNVVNGLTGETGGAQLTIGVMSALENTMKQLAELLATQYVVTYARPAGTRADRLQVAVNKQDVLVAAPGWAPK
jgi:hypothetical protein